LLRRDRGRWLGETIGYAGITLSDAVRRSARVAPGRSSRAPVALEQPVPPVAAKTKWGRREERFAFEDRGMARRGIGCRYQPLGRIPGEDQYDIFDAFR